jgi:hypothetical protein
VSSEDCEAWRVAVYPLIPTDAPSVVMDEDLVDSHIDNLGFKPLVNGVSNIDPHTDLELSVRRFILLNILIVFRAIPRLLRLPVDEPSVFWLDHCEVLRFFTLIICQLITK